MRGNASEFFVNMILEGPGASMFPHNVTSVRKPIVVSSTTERANPTENSQVTCNTVMEHLFG